MSSKGGHKPERYIATQTLFEPAGKAADQNWKRVLITGGRSFGWTAGLNIDAPDYLELYSEKMQERSFLVEVLNEFYEVYRFTDLCHGDAPGADKLAGEWCRQWDNDIAVHRYPANWIKYGKAAGPIRNREMLERFIPDVVLAFPGGKGTEDMKSVAREHGIRVLCPEK